MRDAVSWVQGAFSALLNKQNMLLEYCLAIRCHGPGPLESQSVHGFRLACHNRHCFTPTLLALVPPPAPPLQASENPPDLTGAELRLGFREWRSPESVSIHLYIPYPW